jgi:hypothetical protein
MFTKKGDAAVLAKLQEAPERYREIGKRLHAIIRDSAPSLEPIVRWGLPFYTKDGQDICYIKPDKDFLAFGFGEVQNPAYEEGAGMHPGRVDTHFAGRTNRSHDPYAPRQGGPLTTARHPGAATGMGDRVTPAPA